MKMIVWMFLIIVALLVSVVYEELNLDSRSTNETEINTKPSKNLEREVLKEILVYHAYYEARGESEEGWALVIHNAITRVKSDRFPNTIPEVIFQANPKRAGVPCEYDWTCTIKAYTKIPDEKYKRIHEVVSNVLAGRIKNPCPGAVFYFNPKKVKVNPAWAFDDTYVAKVGNHECHRELPWDEYLRRVKKT